MTTRHTRPLICPCPKSCTPIWNGLAFDDRIKNGDLDEGYSGDCIGKAQETEYVVGGQVHHNNMNHCVFTPLKGIIRFQVNKDDIGSMLFMCKHVLHSLDEKCCESCGQSNAHTHWVKTADGKLRCCSCYYKESISTGQTIY